ncbi:hypothetical protein [Micromonospora sp. RTGN7]|uniref:hypothetical protein n=1 Tax=Micromonospora sp. RTGN7 TaxID=3016526 RepID=UPI0029FF0498|nr:hypothetical protein [Micromonospora sp. RTGN7]
MTFVAGRTATLTVQWYAYPGGPAAVVTGVQVRIAPAGGGTAVVGPTSSGVTAEATGLYSYRWEVPADQAAADYVVTWTGLDGDGDAVTASEVISVASPPVAGGYASVDDLTERLGRTPANAEHLIVRASRDVDRALLCAVYDPDDQVVIDALREATLEQVAGRLDADARAGRRAGFTIGRLSVQASADPGDQPVLIGGLWEQAWTVLQAAGLTGHGPQSR